MERRPPLAKRACVRLTARAMSENDHRPSQPRVPTLVLNFGQSVLRSLDDYRLAAAEIYRHYRRGYNIVAVTSAQGDQSDMLMAEARRVGPGEAAHNLGELLQLGERRSAALLALALERIGASAFVRQARDLGLRARAGTAGQGELTDMDVDALLNDLRNHDIIVMPGYVGIGEKDRPVLLGDGGADFTALYVAERLGVEARLLKDVDGVYEADPKSGGAPKRYDAISWGDALERAGVLIEPKALEFARQRKLVFTVGKPGVAAATRVGPETQPPRPAQPPRRLRIAMMGLGVVGGGVYRRLLDTPERFEIVRIQTRNPDKYVAQKYPADILTSEFDDLLAAKPDIFIDVAGTVEPALSRTRTMLENGVAVVSANKQAIAAGGPELLDFARAKGVPLRFSAAAGGGMPILEMMEREHGRIASVEALLNGTTNYMLDRISAGVPYADALQEAQDKGFAEADPTADVDGLDAAAKIRLVALLGFGEDLPIEDIPRETIRDFDRVAANGAWKRIARVWRDDVTGFHAALELRDLSPASFMAQADAEEAHAEVEFTDGERFRIQGKGAGRWPTTASVMADVFDIAGGLGG